MYQHDTSVAQPGPGSKVPSWPAGITCAAFGGHGGGRMPGMTGEVVGYWRADGEHRIVRTVDGAALTYAGSDPGRGRSSTSRWLRLEVTVPTVPAGTAAGPVGVVLEQRLRGLDGSFRALWYRIPEAPPEPVLRVLVDALASWPA